MRPVVDGARGGRGRRERQRKGDIRGEADAQEEEALWGWKGHAIWRLL
jgi:hypothetical protein